MGVGVAGVRVSSLGVWMGQNNIPSSEQCSEEGEEFCIDGPRGLCLDIYSGVEDQRTRGPVSSRGIEDLVEE